MNKVHVLDDVTINKIAAGEVVERPASVVKELIENALDAHATRIEVEIASGGTSFMRVTDNGDGMQKEDAVLAVQRHATSKIRETTDLNTLQTLGFRGEAIPTIASVSRFYLSTRVAGEEFGTKIEIIGGKQKTIASLGCNVGTTIRVEDLFFNTPARKKFMKTTHTEGLKVNECVVKQALANPHVAFQFINNNKIVITTPGNGDLSDTIRCIYGAQVAEALLPLSFSEDDLAIFGFVTKPSMLRSSRAWQTFLVNARQIESKAMARAVDTAYHALVPKAGYPLVVLHLGIPTASVDVNVHPRKLEVKFEDEGRIFRAVYKAITDAIRPAGQTLSEVAASVSHAERYEKPVPIELPWEMPGGTPSAAGAYTLAMSMRNTSVDRTDAPQIHDTSLSAYTASAHSFVEHSTEAMGSAYARPREESALGIVAEPVEADTASADTLQLEPLGQVARCYIIARGGDSLYIVDQHAAHERILYDRFSALSENIPSQELLVHAILSFDATEASLLEEHQDLFEQLGFSLLACGQHEFRLHAVPMDIPTGEAENVLREILSELFQMHKVTAAEIRHSCIAMTACKAAIKQGDLLNLSQMQIVLDALSKTARPYTCPHGRPTILRFTAAALAKMFKRT